MRGNLIFSHCMQAPVEDLVAIVMASISRPGIIDPICYIIEALFTQVDS